MDKRVTNKWFPVIKILYNEELNRILREDKLIRINNSKNLSKIDFLANFLEHLSKIDNDSDNDYLLPNNAKIFKDLNLKNIKLKILDKPPKNEIKLKIKNIGDTKFLDIIEEQTVLLISEITKIINELLVDKKELHIYNFIHKVSNPFKYSQEYTKYKIQIKVI